MPIRYFCAHCKAHYSSKAMHEIKPGWTLIALACGHSFVHYAKEEEDD